MRSKLNNCFCPGAGQIKIQSSKTLFSKRRIIVSAAIIISSDNLLRLFGISKFVTWKAREEGVGSALVRQIAPPFKAIDAISKDIASAGNEKGLETPASIPLVGKLYYWWFGKGAEKSERRRSRLQGKKGKGKLKGFKKLKTLKGF
jgi:hypothetical protein